MQLWMSISRYNQFHRPLNRDQLLSISNRSIFIHYNLARLHCLIDKFNYWKYCQTNIDYSLLSSPFEWCIIWIDMINFQVLNNNLIMEIFDYNSENIDCIGKILPLIDQLCHRFSCYYRNIKILIQANSQQQQKLIASRVKFCTMILKLLQFYFHNFNVNTIKKI